MNSLHLPDVRKYPARPRRGKAPLMPQRQAAKTYTYSGHRSTVNSFTKACLLQAMKKVWGTVGIG